MAAKSVPSRPAGALTAKKRKLDAVSDGDDTIEQSLVVKLNLPSSELAEILKPKDAFAHMTAISKLPKALKPKKAAKKQRKNPVPNPTIPTPSAAVPTQTPDIKTLPLPWGNPQVWAENRSDLCGALPYFNAYQGSSCTFQGTVRAMLLDFDVCERQYMDEEVVIARAGGGLTDDGNGNRVRTKDQDKNVPRIANFKENMERGIPLILIVGSENKVCPSRVPHRYCVLGAFHVTDIWPEKSESCVIYKFRMEKVDLARKSWWAPENEGPVPKNQKIQKAIALETKCNKCDKKSKQVYKQGWTCLNEECPWFWMINNTEAPENLDFHTGILNQRKPFSGILPPFSVIPKLPDVTSFHMVTKQCWKGIVCPKCGGCNQRAEWAGWKCLTPDCDYELTPPRYIIPASAVMGDLSYEYQGHAISDDAILGKQVTFNRVTHGFYLIHDYHLTNGIIVTHGHSNGIINSQPGGANDAFRGLQEGSLGLRRLLLQTQTTGSRSAHFSKDFGLPYKYHVAQPDSTSFADSPAEICEAVRRMTWVGRRHVGNGPEVVFNECLAVGYFEGGKMGYHDDGEKSLGPNIAAWSLGCPAMMNVRMKFKYYSGFSKDRKKYRTDLPILPGCFKPEVRRELNLMRGLTEKALTKKAKELLKGVPSSPPAILKMKLRHGDFMSMHGADMQLYYEHEVVPTNELRFGLTCRYIKPEDVDEDQHYKGELDLDPEDAYDGDLQTFTDRQTQENTADDLASARRQGAPPIATEADV